MKTVQTLFGTEADAQRLVDLWTANHDTFPGVSHMERQGRIVLKTYNKQTCPLCGNLTGRTDENAIYVGMDGPLCDDCLKNERNDW